MSDEKMKVLLVKPGEYARATEIGSDLESMQAAVGGWIEEYMPFEDDVALVCNEEGKMNGLDLNRAIYSEDGQMMDIIAGDFFVCYAPIESERFQSLPDNLMDKYEKKFYYDNKDIIDIKTRLSDEEQAYKDKLNEMLNLK